MYLATCVSIFLLMNNVNASSFVSIFLASERCPSAVWRILQARVLDGGGQVLYHNLPFFPVNDWEFILAVLLLAVELLLFSATVPQASSCSSSLAEILSLVS